MADIGYPGHSNIDFRTIIRRLH